MKNWKPLLLCSLLATASLQAGACYTVYDASNQIVYNARTAPVDMSQPISQTLPKVFPGGHLVVTDSTDCPRGQPAPLVSDRTGNAPLLTDRRTAAAMNVPHTILASGVALVRNAEAPNVNAAPVALAAPPRTETVITEMHNPPLTVVQVGGMVVSPLR